MAAVAAGAVLLLRPVAGHDPVPLDAGRLGRIDPGEFAGAIHRGGYQHAPEEAGTAQGGSPRGGLWGQAQFGIVEGEQFSEHVAPGARCGAFGDGSGNGPDRRACVATSANGSLVPQAKSLSRPNVFSFGGSPGSVDRALPVIDSLHRGGLLPPPRLRDEFERLHREVRQNPMPEHHQAHWEIGSSRHPPSSSRTASKYAGSEA